MTTTPAEPVQDPDQGPIIQPDEPADPEVVPSGPQVVPTPDADPDVAPETAPAPV